MNTQYHILVTGGAGFIGRYLCKALLLQGHHVTCVDSLITGNERNISEFQSNLQFRFIEADASTLVYPDSIDIIYHLAGLASPIAYLKDPIYTGLSTLNTTHHMLELARKNQAKFIFTSSSEVYGDPKVHPQDESYWGEVNCVGERACYKESKRFAETLVSDYQRRYKLAIQLPRIFNTYGPYMDIDDGRVVTSFIRECLDDKPLVIHGSGLQTRSFCYVSDMVSALCLLVDAPYTGPINLGNDTELSVLDLAKTVSHLMGKGTEVSNTVSQADDSNRRCPSIEKAKQLLEWYPKVSLEQGLKETISFYRSLPK